MVCRFPKIPFLKKGPFGGYNSSKRKGTNKEKGCFPFSKVRKFEVYVTSKATSAPKNADSVHHDLTMANLSMGRKSCP